MSTGRKPYKSNWASALVDDEASTKGEEEDLDKYEGSFIDDQDVDDRNSITWSQTASPIDNTVSNPSTPARQLKQSSALSFVTIGILSLIGAVFTRDAQIGSPNRIRVASSPNYA
ncbi:hypothetical protein DFH08DRAFT_812504 [Mycena albidolilacea]|uniref:Uncharacterized protein n=1 Tax=Mycena albidolilacea TaxID=1033008 RepID=A0AAD6ZTL3_9AGAR|nr:hypothetical protein DFH08DRAFT_812504 [Mycena albidolilacea]